MVPFGFQIHLLFDRNFFQPTFSKISIHWTANEQFSWNLICMCLSVIYSINAAEDWLKPGVVLEAFEARSARMCVACAENLSKFENPEDGMFSIP